MKPRFSTGIFTVFLTCSTLLCGNAPQPADPDGIRRLTDQWRAHRRIIDLHQHIDYTPEHLARAVRIMDRAGIGLEVNLSGGTTTRQEGKQADFERNKGLADQLFPGRFVHYMNLDYADWDQADFSERAVKQVEEGHRLGAAGSRNLNVSAFTCATARAN